jgi:hypothetical protein
MKNVSYVFAMVLVLGACGADSSVTEPCADGQCLAPEADGAVNEGSVLGQTRVEQKSDAAAAVVDAGDVVEQDAAAEQIEVEQIEDAAPEKAPDAIAVAGSGGYSGAPSNLGGAGGYAGTSAGAGGSGGSGGTTTATSPCPAGTVTTIIASPPDYVSRLCCKATAASEVCLNQTDAGGTGGTPELPCSEDCSKKYPNAIGICNLGYCVMNGCKAGFGDCNHRVEDGCESVVAAGETCLDCPKHCAEKNPQAVGVSAWKCVGGVCAIKACLSSLDLGLPIATDCNDDVSDGCETAVYSDPNNCGYCNHKCGSGACSQGTCAY